MKEEDSNCKPGYIGWSRVQPMQPGGQVPLQPDPPGYIYIGWNRIKPIARRADTTLARPPGYIGWNRVQPMQPGGHVPLQPANTPSGISRTKEPQRPNSNTVESMDPEKVPFSNEKTTFQLTRCLFSVHILSIRISLYSVYMLKTFSLENGRDCQLFCINGKTGVETRKRIFFQRSFCIHETVFFYRPGKFRCTK